MNKKELADFEFAEALNQRQRLHLIGNQIHRDGYVNSYGIITIVGQSTELFTSLTNGVNQFSQNTVMQLRSLGYQAYGKTGACWSQSTNDRACQAIGSMTKGDIRSSSWARVVYDHLVNNELDVALHLCVGVNQVVGGKEQHLDVERVVAEELMYPLNITLLNDQKNGRNHPGKNHSRLMASGSMSINTGTRTFG